MTKPFRHFRSCGAAGRAALCLLAVLAAAPDARAQVCGDVNADDQVTTSDALRVLKKSVGQDVELVCEDQCAALETRLAALEALLEHLTVDGDNLVLTGMNFQVVSGSGDTDGEVNGTGNIIIGYNEANSNSEERGGSHNLVIGRHHGYESYGGIVAGEDNLITGESASVLGGADNEASGDGSVVVAGQGNETRQTTTAILAGEGNVANGRSCSVVSGASNLCSGIVSTVDGGAQNVCSGQGSVIGGGSNRTLGSPFGWLAGAFGPTF